MSLSHCSTWNGRKTVFFISTGKKNNSLTRLTNVADNLINVLWSKIKNLLPATFCLFSFFKTVDSTYISNLKFADGWIRSVGLWCLPTEKQPLSKDAIFVHKNVVYDVLSSKLVLTPVCEFVGSNPPMYAALELVDWLKFCKRIPFVPLEQILCA